MGLLTSQALSEDILSKDAKSIYVVISQTHTRFGTLVRSFGKTQYNHAAIALDSRLNQMYAFARPQRNALLLGRLVHESVMRYAIGNVDFVQVAIFRIPVTTDQYKWVKDTIQRIHGDRYYLYNLFSVLTYPLTGGFRTYKAFSCIEFVMYILRGLGYKLDKPIYKYKPDDLLDFLTEKQTFSGNLLEYKPDKPVDDGYLAPFTSATLKSSVFAFREIFVRTFLKRKHCSMGKRL